MALHKLISMLLLWGVLLFLYLVVSGAAGIDELIAGGIVAGMTTAFSLMLQRVFGKKLLYKSRWLLPLFRIVPAMFHETWQLYVAFAKTLAGRTIEGRFIEHPYKMHPGDPHEPVRFALMAFGVCITPNSYLVSFDRNSGKVLVHQLVGKQLSTTDKAFVELP